MERGVVGLGELAEHAVAVVLRCAGDQVGGVGVVHLQAGDQQVERGGGEDGHGSESLGAELAPGQPDHRAASVVSVVLRWPGSAARSM